MKKFLATGAMLAYITWFNSTGALAATMPEINAADDIQGPKHHQNARHQNKQEKAAKLADKLGIDLTQLHLDLAAGIAPKEVMKSYSLNKNQLRELVGKRAR
jgi:hypothetical protein